MRFAFLIMYELRSMETTFETLKKRIVDYYNADVFCLCQKTFEDEERQIKRFDTLKKYEFYEKPDPVIFFGKTNHTLKWNADYNWKCPGNQQVYINNKKYADFIKDHVDDYDYFIMLRSDIDVLFDFPPAELFETSPTGVYSFFPLYAGDRGAGGGNFVHKSFLLDYLTCYYDYLTDEGTYEELKSVIELDPGFHQEVFLILALRHKGITMKKITSLNHYYTAPKIGYRTTTATVIEHKGVICKYTYQLGEAQFNLTKWDEGQEWVYKDGVMKLWSAADDDRVFRPLNEAPAALSLGSYAARHGR